MPHHRSRLAGVVAAALVLGASAAAFPAHAADVFVDATLRLPIGDDARLFLRVTREQYAQPEPQATALLQRCRRPQEDYPTVMFLAMAAHRRPETVLDLRLQGLGWSAVMTRLQIAPEPLFAGLDRDPGPPYGNAWGHWKNHPRNAHAALSDAQIVDLAKLQIASRACGTNPYEVIGDRRRGLTVEQAVVQRTRPGGNRGKDNGHGHDHGHDHGHGHGHGHGHDHGDEHGDDDQR